MTTSKTIHARAAAAGTITLGGDLTVNRMGFGAMRLTGKGIWENVAAAEIRLTRKDMEELDRLYSPHVSGQS